jgi:integrase
MEQQKKQKKRQRYTGSVAADAMPWEEAKRLMNELYRKGDYKYFMIMLIGIYFGLRISDIRRVTWKDLISGGTLTIKEKKTGRVRRIPINNQIRNLAYQIYNRTHHPGRYVVTVDRNTINQKLRRLKKKYNLQIEQFSTHSFRKTFGRRYLEKNNFSGKALITLSETFGHKSLKDTQKYLGITKKEIEQVYVQVSNEQIVTP